MQGPKAAPAIVDALRRCATSRRSTCSCSRAAAGRSRICCRSATSGSCARSPRVRPDRLRGGTRAGHAALRSRCGRTRVDADGGRKARRPRPAKSWSRGSTARARRCSARFGVRSSASDSGSSTRARDSTARRRSRSSASARRSSTRTGRLRTLSPRSTLARGYAIVRAADGIVRSRLRRRARTSTSRWRKARSERRLTEASFEELERELEQIVDATRAGQGLARRGDRALGARRGALQAVRRQARLGAREDRGAGQARRVGAAVAS